MNLKTTQSKCHIYSLPYQFEYLLEINNSVPGGIFHTVRVLVLKDLLPFEHQFFQIISRDVPFVQILYVRNEEPQKDKQNSSAERIIFAYLKLLYLRLAYVDYAEQFLLKKRTALPY